MGMIVTIEANQVAEQSQLLDEMFVARKQVFGDRMGWTVTALDGRERDTFDECNPLYLLSIDPVTRLSRGSLRLLPASGPTMLNSVFSSFFDQPVDVSSPLIWECTRFCTHPNATDHLTSHGVSAITAELLIGICEAALNAGILQIVGVFDERMVRIYRRGGWSPEVIARSVGAGHGAVSVGLWDVSEVALERMYERAGLLGSVFNPPADSEAMAA
jgi:acyl homoserine lactone synthase